jgi:hypothetical protein
LWQEKHCYWYCHWYCWFLNHCYCYCHWKFEGLTIAIAIALKILPLLMSDVKICTRGHHTKKLAKGPPPCFRAS